LQQWGLINCDSIGQWQHSDPFKHSFTALAPFEGLMIMLFMRSQAVATVLVYCLVLLAVSPKAQAADVYLRCKVTQPLDKKLRITIGGFPHQDPWSTKEKSVDVAGGAWSDWVDLRAWPWPVKFNRAGGIAEWPAARITLARVEGNEPISGCSIDVQLADKPREDAVVHSFTEHGGIATVAFLVPHPLREHAAEFETGSQMTARHLAWAREITSDKPVELKQFQFITALWGHYDPELASKSIDALQLLGFNVIGNADPAILRSKNIRSYNASWLYMADPAAMDAEWNRYVDATLKPASKTEAGQWNTTKAAHWVVSDEITTLNFVGLKPEDLDGWFHNYLREKGVTDADLGQPIAHVHYPAAAMFEKTLPRDGALPARTLLYHAAKFGHFFSAKQLRHGSDLIRASLPGMKTETLPSDHGFFGAWGPPHLGMSYRMLDLFELGSQQTVDQLSSEDWMGLNHMYGPAFTWSGAQSFEYFNAICRSAIADNPIHLRALITPNDDRYLRLKTYSALGQGTKSFFFWTFGPTYISTENYWSDLRSEYEGIAKLGRVMQQAEPILYPAKPLRDPVAILYSVSHDIWHSDNAAAFAEKRLTWHALRHLGIQPDFLREEDIEAGKLGKYNVLYVADWCLSRKASAAIDAWVKQGGVVHLSCGAATRDEACEPYTPAFAVTVWAKDAASKMKIEPGHAYNERVDLPSMKAITTSRISADGATGELPVLGCRIPMSDHGKALATFVDTSSRAGAVVDYGKGKVFGWGFMPMLAYAQLAGFKPETLEEHWPQLPRQIVKLALDAGGITPVVRADADVVEGSLLTGEAGAAIVLANYTYQPIAELAVDVSLPADASFKDPVSTEGKPVKAERTPQGIRLHLPLEWTDIVLLPKR
jgi:hypothetical protein